MKGGVPENVTLGIEDDTFCGQTLLESMIHTYEAGIPSLKLREKISKLEKKRRTYRSYNK